MNCRTCEYKKEALRHSREIAAEVARIDMEILKRNKQLLGLDDEILCGYLGGCGSRLNGKCERTQKCSKWKKYDAGMSTADVQRVVRKIKKQKQVDLKKLAAYQKEMAEVGHKFARRRP
jgi:hypothetical protein